nr:MAG TPA: hypothetical protein [Bacteriophage sp.]
MSLSYKNKIVSLYAISSKTFLCYKSVIYIFFCIVII